MAKLLQAEDALDRAIASNYGLDALVRLMFSAQEADAPDMKHLADLVWSVQKDIASHLDNLQRCLKN